MDFELYNSKHGNFTDSKIRQINFDYIFSTDFPTLSPDYQNVLAEIKKDLNITNNLTVTNPVTPETELEIEDLFSIPELKIDLPDPIPATPKQDYKHDYDKLVEENRNFMKSLKTILECPVCLTMVSSSPVPSCSNGHIVCSSCWNLTHLCPLCRVKLHEKEKFFSQTANSLLELVLLPCPYDSGGCNYQGKRAEVEHHQQNCLFRDNGQAQDTMAMCAAPGCRIGKQKKDVKKKNVRRRIRPFTIRATSAPQTHQLSAPITSAPQVIPDPNRLVPVRITIPAEHGNLSRDLTVQVPAHTLQQGRSSALQQVMIQAIPQALSLPPEQSSSYLQTQINEAFSLA
eukprot:GFUD01006330.1.p1 GENE.GFUD01006330.1~~GFUD01006330.1.p1  ORF type:complete len:343 (+),score=80.45 GFUD01006330.1:144-1172(+)